MKIIKIKKSQTADTRTCDFSRVSLETLKEASEQHIEDVQKAGDFFRSLIFDRFHEHDSTKLTHLLDFHRDFITGFKIQEWYDMHRKFERHHLAALDGVRPDVDLIDVLEYLSDCIMAGKARTGTVTEITIDPVVLMTAFENSVKMLTNHVTVDDQP